MTPYTCTASSTARRRLGRTMRTMARWGRRPVFWGRHLATVPEGAVVFFPLRPSWLSCGLAGIVAVKGGKNATDETTVDQMEALLDICMAHGLDTCRQKGLALADAFECGVNDLPLSIVLSWYEQKAVAVLLTLLHLGIKDIKIGPSLPAFVTPNVLNFLVENFNLGPITTAEADLKEILGA